MSDKDIKILKYETVRDKLNTRENSTLVVATVASSASLVLLAFNSRAFHIFGVIFAILGIIYRELTIFFSDFPEQKLLEALEQELTIVELQKTLNRKYNLSKKNKGVRTLRSFIIRSLLFLPVMLFFYLKYSWLLTLINPMPCLFALIFIILLVRLLIALVIVVPLYYEEKNLVKKVRWKP